MFLKWRLVIVAAAALAGCADSPTQVEHTSADMAYAAATFGATQMGASATAPVARACPDGGSVLVERVATVDSAGYTSVLRSAATLQYTDCGIVLDGTRALINGRMDLESTIEFSDNGSDRATILSQSSRQSGQFETDLGGRKDSCSLDLQTSFRPADDLYVTTGTLCGRQVQYSMPRLRRSM